MDTETLFGVMMSTEEKEVISESIHSPWHARLARDDESDVLEVH